MKPITRQLIIAAFFLTFVTAASFGVRHVRFAIHRARTTGDTVVSEIRAGHDPVEARVVPAQPEPQPLIVAESYKTIPSDDYADTLAYSGKKGKAASQAKLSKGDKAKAKGSKSGLEKISLAENEDLYITHEGRLVYVGRGTDGQTVKMQVQIDEATGEMRVVSKAENAKSAGAKNMQKISMGGDDAVYITEEGQTWYVTEGSKARVEMDNSTGEITVLEQYSNGGK